MVSKKILLLEIILLFVIVLLTKNLIALNVNLVTPSNNTYTNNLTFICNVTDSIQVSNLTLYIWNSSGNAITPNMTYLTGTENSSSWIATLSSEGSYTWNCLGYDNSTNTSWASTNYSFIYDNTNPSLIINYPVNNQYYGSTDIVINLTQIDTNFNYSFIRIIDSIGDVIDSINSSTQGNVQVTLGVSSDGDYSVNVTSYDLAGNMNYSGKLIHIDTSPPDINFSTATREDYSNVSLNWIFFNLSLTNDVVNITYKLYNSSNYLLNSTTLSRGAGNYFNFTNLSNGIYYYNATCVDNSSNVGGTSSTRTITLDSSAPIFTNLTNLLGIVNHSFIHDLDVNDLTSVNFTLNDTSLFNISLLNGIITNVSALNTTGLYYLTVNATDILGNVNSSSFSINISIDNFDPSITLTGPEDQYAVTSGSPITYTYTVYDNSTTSCYLRIDGAYDKNYNYSVDINGGENSFTNTTTATGTHSWYIYCIDIYGNDASSSTLQFVINSNTSSDDDSSSSSSSSSAAIAAYYWTSTFVPTFDQFITGYSKPMAVKERIRLTLGNEDHYVGVVALSTTTATVNVSSTPQQAVMNVGDEKKFEVTGDNIYDIYVMVNSINNSRVNLTIRTINEIIVESSTTTSPTTSSTPEEDIYRSSEVSNIPVETPQNTNENSVGFIKKNFFWIIVGIILFFIMLTVILIFFIFRSEKPNEKNVDKIDRFISSNKNKNFSKPGTTTNITEDKKANLGKK